MNIERTDPQGAIKLAEFFSGPEDQKLKKELTDITESYIRNLIRLDPGNLEDIDKAREEFERLYKLEINYCTRPKHSFDEEKSPEARAALTRVATAQILKELFNRLNPQPIIEVQKRQNWFQGLLRQKPPQPLADWQRGRLMEAAFGVLTYAGNKSNSYTEEPVSPRLLDALRKGIQGWHEKPRENFSINIAQFVDSPHLEIK